jgi:four helix bundle protein
MEEKTMKQQYDLEDRLLEFSVRIVKLVEALPKSKTGQHISHQLLRSGTSAYANHGEAQSAESPKDFVHKLRISLKELRETQRWLKLIQAVPLLDHPEKLNKIVTETEELIKIFVSSIKTSEKKQKTKK